jgi:hypothetical protein
MNHRTCEVTSWAHVWMLHFSFFERGYDGGPDSLIHLFGCID